MDNTDIEIQEGNPTIQNIKGGDECLEDIPTEITIECEDICKSICKCCNKSKTISRLGGNIMCQMPGCNRPAFGKCGDGMSGNKCCEFEVCRLYVCDKHIRLTDLSSRYHYQVAINCN